MKENIFEKDFLIFPLNLPEHWSTFIVCNHNSLIKNFLKSQDNQIDVIEDEDNVNKPCIIYFDSFGLLDERYASIVRM